MPIYEDDGPDGYYIASPEDVLERIRGRKPYVDRMTIWFSEDPRYDMERLKRLCVDAIPNSRKPRMRRMVKFADVWCRYKLDILQPSRAAFDYLIEHTNPPVRHFINSVEMSLDFTTDTQQDLLYVRSFFERHWIKPHHRSRWFNREVGVRPPRKENTDLPQYAQLPAQGTQYYAKRKTPVHYKMYSDFPSKVNRKPCCHLEVKLQGHPTIRKAHLDSFDSYLGPGVFRKFWEKHLQLRKPKDEDELKTIIDRLARKNMVDEDEETIRLFSFAMFKGAYYSEDSYMAQELADYGKLLSDRDQLLEEIPNRPFLPSRAAKIPLRLYPNR